MNHKLHASLALASAILAFAIASGAGDQPATALPAAAVPAAAVPAAAVPAAAVPTAKPAPQEAKTPRMSESVIRLNAPIFSPQFANVPLAAINDEFITMEDLKKALGAIHEGMKEETPVSKNHIPELFNRLVNSKLIIQEARNIGLDKLDHLKKSTDEYSVELLRETLLFLQAKDVKVDEKDVDKAYAEASREWRFKSLIIPNQEDVKAFQAGLKSGKTYDQLYDAAIKEGKAKEGGKPDEVIPRSAVSPELLALIDKMKPGEVSPPLPLGTGAVFYRVEEVRSKEDPELRFKIRTEVDKKTRVKALEEYKQGLIKKNVKLNKKVYDKISYKVTKAQFEKLLKDKRVIADIKGEKPITVAELTEALKSKYFHGIERALEGNKVNISKDMVYDEILTTRLFQKDARDRRVAESEEFRTRLKAYVDSLLFNEFITKIVRDDVRMTTDDLEAYYKEHSKEFTSPAGLSLTALAFDALPKAELAVDKLRNGTDYKWYKDNAEGQTSISKEYIDYFAGTPVTFDSLPEKLAKAMVGAKTGEFRVFPDGKVTYAIAVLEVIKSDILPFERVEEVIRQRVFYDKLNKTAESWADKIRASSEITIYADFAKQEKP